MKTPAALDIALALLAGSVIVGAAVYYLLTQGDVWLSILLLAGIVGVFILYNSTPRLLPASAPSVGRDDERQS